MGTNTVRAINRKVPKVAIVTANPDIIGAHGTVTAVYSNPAAYWLLCCHSGSELSFSSLGELVFRDIKRTKKKELANLRH